MRPTTPIQEATPEEIHRRRQSGEDLLLIDVREHEEIAVAALPEALVCPLSQAAEWIDRLPKDQPLVILPSRDPQHACGNRAGGTRP